MNIEKKTYFGYMILTLTAVASILLGLALSVSTANATPFNLLQGDFQITGNAYIDNDYNQAPGDTRGARGIAEVLQVTNGSTIVWDRTTASTEYNLIFQDYEVINTGVFASTRLFESMLGSVNILENPLGTFSAAGLFAVDSANIASNSLSTILSLTGNGNTFGSITAVNGVDVAFLATGLLDVIGGSDASFFDNNNLANGADLSFQLSGDNIDTNGYTFSGSSDIGGTVPSPAPLALIGLGLVAMRRAVKSKQV